MRIIVKFLELLYNPFPFYGNFLETELRILVVIFDMIIGTPEKPTLGFPQKNPLQKHGVNNVWKPVHVTFKAPMPSGVPSGNLSVNACRGTFKAGDFDHSVTWICWFSAFLLFFLTQKKQKNSDWKNH